MPMGRTKRKHVTLYCNVVLETDSKTLAKKGSDHPILYARNVKEFQSWVAQVLVLKLLKVPRFLLAQSWF